MSPEALTTRCLRLLVHDPIRLNDLLKVLGFLLLAVQLSGFWRYSVRRFEALGLVAALLFLIALILELTNFPAVTDTILTTIGFRRIRCIGPGPNTCRAGARRLVHDTRTGRTALPAG